MVRPLVETRIIFHSIRCREAHISLLEDKGVEPLMARSPSHRIPQLRAPPWAKFLENQISGKIAGPKENTIIAIISVQVDKWRQKSSAECAWCFLAHW